MAANTLNILTPSVNNLTVRIFVRAAGLDFEEVDVWGKTTDAGVPGEVSGAPDADARGRTACRAGTLGESCAIMAYLCNKHGLDQFYPTDPGRRAMVDNAMFYLIGTFYPLLARATYPTLGFPQYAGEVATSDADDAMKAKAAKDAEAALAEPLEVFHSYFIGRPAVHRRRPPVDRRHPAGRDARVPARDRLRLPGLGRGVHERDGVGARRRVLGAGRRRARLRGLGQGLSQVALQRRPGPGDDEVGVG